MIQLRNITHRYRRNTVLQNVNLDIGTGDFIAVTGPNGGGKTTLLRIILRLLTPSEGTVEYSAPAPPVIGYLPQKSSVDTQFPISVEEVVASGLINQSGNSKRQALDDTLRMVDLNALRRNAINELSGGQLQRALLGRAIIARPQLLVLDEPLSYLDQTFEQRFYDILRTLAPTTTIILVSHEMDTIAQMASRHIIVAREIHECDAAHHFSHTHCD